MHLRAPVRLAAPILACSLAVLLPACRGGDSVETQASGEPREAVVDLTITEDAGADHTFGRVSGMVTDRNGRLYVADGPSNEVRVFGPDGKFLYRIGRKGQGPGEFAGPCCLALRDGDTTLWVRDGGNARYLAFAVGDTAATFRTSVRMAHTDVNRWAPLAFDSEGNIIDVGSIPRPFEAVRGTSDIGRFHLDINSKPEFDAATTRGGSGSAGILAGHVISVDTIPSPPKDSVPVHLVNRTMGTSKTILYVYQPYGPLALVAHAPDGEWARGISSRYSIAWYGADGKLLRTLERAVEGPALTATERATAEESVERDMKRTGLTRGEMPYSIPDRKPPLRDMWFDQDGRLWVQHSVMQGMPARADVYAPDGRLLYDVTWPVRTELDGASRGDVIYGVRLDSLDTPGIVRMKLTQRPAGGR